ncbi:MAG: hypothetical protein RLZ62_1498 [Bacteroidota bacterium]
MRYDLYFLLLCFFSYGQSAYSQKNYNQILRETWQSLPENAKVADSIGNAFLLEFAENPSTPDSLFAKTWFLLGQSSMYQSKRNLALSYYQKVLQSPFVSESPAIADACWNNMAIIYERQTKYAEAVEAYKKSLAISEQQDDSSMIVTTWLNIGLLNQLMGAKNQSVEILGKTLDYFLRHKDTVAVADSYLNMANTFYPDNISQAEQYYNKSLQLYKSVNHVWGQTAVLVNLAKLESDRANYSKSSTLLREVVSMSGSSNMDGILATAYRILAKNEIDADGNLILAREYLNKARQLSVEAERKDQMKGIFEVELLLEMKRGDYTSYKKVLENYIKYQEEQSVENAHLINAEFQAIHEVKNITEQKSRLEEGILRKNRQLLLTLLALLGATLAVAIIAIQYRKLKQASAAMFRMNVEIANSFPGITPALQAMEPDTTRSGSDSEPEEERALINLYNAILNRLETEKLYLDPSLGVQDFCQKMNRNQRYVSRAISDVGKTNFPNLINRFRVNEARRLLTSGASLSTSEIVEKTGFGSRAAFHRNFKAATGFSPIEYQSMAKNTPEKLPEF